MPKPIPLRPQTVRINAPRELVFQMLSRFGRGRLPGDNAEASKVISREGNSLVVEFKTKAQFATYTTTEAVTLYPPERIAFRHLSGPLRYAVEEFAFADVDGAQTDLTHSGKFIWSRVPLFGRLGGMIYTRPVFERTLAKHLAHVKAAAEARAARSHVFARR